MIIKNKLINYKHFWTLGLSYLFYVLPRALYTESAQHIFIVNERMNKLSKQTGW